VLICNPKYPQRCAHMCLEELQRTVSILPTAALTNFIPATLSVRLTPPRSFPSFPLFLPQFVSKVGDKASTAKDRSLDKQCSGLLQKICQKYDNLAEVDKLASVARKVDTVKLVMQENVDAALQNCVKLESIEKAAGKC